MIRTSGRFDHDFRALLGTELPIIQAPMAGVQGIRLAAAVNAAGGLGSLPAGLMSPLRLRDELSRMVAATARPYNVNFLCHLPPRRDSSREAHWATLLRRFHRELGIGANSAAAYDEGHSFSSETVDVLEGFAPAVVSFHFGLPARHLVARIKSWGTKVLSTATTVAEARWLEARGVDGIIAQGLEAGGPRGNFLSDDLTLQTGIFALLPQIADAVELPVIAAGGIGNARSVRAALALGATAVQVGTAYLLCPEADTSRVHRALLRTGMATHTAIANIFSGHPGRVIVNRLVREVGPMSADAPDFPLPMEGLSALRDKAEAAGSSDFTPLWTGQNASDCREMSALAFTRSLVAAA